MDEGALYVHACGIEVKHHGVYNYRARTYHIHSRSFDFFIRVRPSFKSGLNPTIW